MRVLVTGGAGYIGSHTAKALSRAGHEPVALDDLRTGHLENVRFGPFVQADLLDADALRAALRREEVEAAIHFAASAYVRESMSAPREYFRNNVVGSLNLLDALVGANVRFVVFSSTCATYGAAAEVPILESSPQTPINPYGESKLFVERALAWYDHAYGLRSFSLRYFNAAGADPEGELGEAHDPETHLIPLAFDAALGRRPTLEVLGRDHATPDGTPVRDYVHVSDLADAHVAALHYLLEGGATTAANLGSGRGHSVAEVIATIERITGLVVPRRFGPRHPGDPPTLVADASRGREVLGFSPRYSDLESIVASAWAWHRRLRGM